ncbi:MAG: nuclear transport factor 2 family protein [Novosphingobium sp.]|nr:nuclear transport factor 2 family protein [Novosphingobium sp.]
MIFEDYLAIKNLIHRYPQCTDKGDFEGVGKLLGDATMGELDHEPAFLGDGAEAFTDIYASVVRKFPERGTPRTRHFIGNVIIEDDGPDKAHAESYVIVFQQTDDLPLQPIIGGTYFDRFAKVDGEWRFTHRTEDMELIGDLSEHLLRDMTA